MSYYAANEAECTACEGSVELLIEPHEKDLGDFTVRRVLPAPQRTMVGPFIFFDHMGPAEFPPGNGIQVRPHPHIGIATITYLFDGEIIHRDSLGVVQPIQAGAVNLMTAGRGIVHSERAGEDFDRISRLHGIQSWIALPDGKEDIEPAFAHTPANEIPRLDIEGVRVALILGTAFGRSSPVTTYSSTLFLECLMSEGSRVALPDDYPERAAYVVEGEVRIDDLQYGAGAMAVARPGSAMVVQATRDTRLMIIGGEPTGERHIWWNFVASSKARIEAAKLDWNQGRFDTVPGDSEFIPLPGR